jgi:hypothetical protein
MNNKTQTYWLIGLGIGTAVLVGLGVAYRKEIRRGITKGLSKFKKSVVDIANSEWNLWNANGKIKEGDSRTWERLKEYWKDGGKVTWFSDSEMKNEAWSAVFISWVMKMGGAGSDFVYNASHSKYIRASIKNRKENNQNPFKGYRPDEVKVEVGDLVCYPRQGNVGYDTTSSYKSHCDLVTKVSKGEAESIGGNVSNSVTKTNVPLTPDGKIDKSRDKKSYGGYFVVIKNNK